MVNSFDPNDKSCLDGRFFSPDQAGNYIHYLIRFENEGNADAINIAIEDKIDTTVFNINSLVVTASSHECMTLIEGNIVRFIFDDIYLPFDSTDNNGYISFKLETKTSITQGDTLSNAAEIYFDFNPGIRTKPFSLSSINS